MHAGVANTSGTVSSQPSSAMASPTSEWVTYHVYSPTVDQEAAYPCHLPVDARVQDLRVYLSHFPVFQPLFSISSVKFYKFGYAVSPGNAFSTVLSQFSPPHRPEPMLPTARLDSHFPQRPSQDVIISLRFLYMAANRPKLEVVKLVEGDTTPEFSAFFSIYGFLWGQKENWDKSIDVTHVDVPSLECSLLRADDQGMVTQTEFRFLNIDRLPGPFKKLLNATPRLLIRDQYGEADRFLEECSRVVAGDDIVGSLDQSPKSAASGPPSAPPRRHIDMLLLGQPGIGKWLYLIYLLLKRLTERKTTVFSYSPTQRYLFREDGVYYIPNGTISNVPNIDHHDNNALVLYYLNDSQNTVEEFISWPHVVTSPPQVEWYSRWEEKCSHSNARFVMNTWSWPEVYFIRDQAFIGPPRDRTLDQWRVAFSSFGGIPKYLLRFDDARMQMKIQDKIGRLRPLMSFSSDRIYQDSWLMHINCIEGQPPGFTLRQVSNMKLATPYIAYRLMEQWRTTLAKNFVSCYLPFIRSNFAASYSGIIFEQEAQNYILKYPNRPLILTSLVDSSTLSLDLQHIDSDGPDWFTTLSDLTSKTRNMYHRPHIPNMGGVDSFVLTVDDNNDIVGLVAFQFTPEEPRPIRAKFLEEIWELLAPIPTFEQHIAFVFVVPEEKRETMKMQPYEPPSEGSVWENRITQYTIGLNLETLWDYLDFSYSVDSCVPPSPFHSYFF